MPSIERFNIHQMLSYQEPLAEPVKPGLFPSAGCSPCQHNINPTRTMDLIPVFNEALRSHNADPVEPYIFRLQDLEEFLKEAYRIVGHVAYSTTSIQTNQAASVRILQNSIPTSVQYDSLIFQLPIHRGGKSLREPALLPHYRPQTKTRST